MHYEHKAVFFFSRLKKTKQLLMGRNRTGVHMGLEGFSRGGM